MPTIGPFAPDALADRLILVTGASSGLGRESAYLFAELGARLALIGRNEAELARTADTIGRPDRVTCYPGDLSDDDAADSITRQVVAAQGELHGVFHAAGTSLVAPMRLTKSRQVAELLGPAVLGSLGIARAISRKGAMAAGGSLVFMSSVSALRGRKGMVAYSAAKAATSGLVRALAVELADRRIRVNSIAAGAVATEMHIKFVNSVSEDIVRGYADLHPLGFGRPIDVAYAAAFLLSDAAAWLTGVDLSVDGGYAAK